MFTKKLLQKNENSIPKKPNDLKKKLAIVGISLAVLTTNYSGNSFGMKDYIDQKISNTRDAVVSTFSRDIGINANTLQRRINNSDNITQYTPELQDLVYTINQNLQETEQRDTIEKMIDQLSEPAKEDIFLRLYTRLPEASRQSFDELVLEHYSENNVLSENWNEFRNSAINLYGALKNNFGNWLHNE